jgi:hypothetical protein
MRRPLLGITVLAGSCLTFAMLGAPASSTAQALVPTVQLCRPRDPGDCYELRGLEKNINGVSSRYSVEALGDSTHISHHFYLPDGTVVADWSLAEPIAPRTTRVYNVADIASLPDSFRGDAAIDSVWPVIVSTMPPATATPTPTATPTATSTPSARLYLPMMRHK